MKLDEKMTVGELIVQHPSAMDIFIKKRMLCIGYPAQDCHTLEDVAEIYGYTRESFLRTLSKAIKNDKKP
jgi:hybrid cluster-associated redox disulfide protein